ncbi:hypothetical protein WME75_02050 [Sorangium sp. So ce1014]|uniref:hypothetical protein n=1 Tax=Sorangium sp. So ce1014 TaxID=3133326 RepID=UPI003F5DFAEE
MASGGQRAAARDRDGAAERRADRDEKRQIGMYVDAWTRVREWTNGVEGAAAECA